MNYIDIHAHLNFPNYNEDRESVIKRTKKHQVGVINVGTNMATSKEVIELAKENENFYATVGIHPSDLGKLEVDDARERILQMTENEKVVAIGECGLDYYRISGDPRLYKEKQIEFFKMQIEVAIEKELPLMIHCRDAYEEIIEILKEYEKRTREKGDLLEGKKMRGNFHFFVGNMGNLKDILGLGFTVSFTGVITFAPQYEEIVEAVPLQKIHAETDSPFVAPKQFRGQRNEPLYVLNVIQKIAEIKKIGKSEVEKQLLLNAEETFNINL